MGLQRFAVARPAVSRHCFEDCTLRTKEALSESFVWINAGGQQPIRAAAAGPTRGSPLSGPGALGIRLDTD